MVEKRRYPRIPMTGWAEVRIEGASETLNGYVTNVSLGGIALYTKKF